MKQARRIFRFLRDAVERGERSALVTVTKVVGRGARRPGTHFAVTEAGAAAGSLSSGCLEAAVVAEAQRVIRADQAEVIRLGQGSPFIDIRLPCGGGLDLLITPVGFSGVMAEAEQRLAERKTVTLAISRHGGLRLVDHLGLRPRWLGKTFISPHPPDLRLFVAGHGAETVALATLAHAASIETIVITPSDLVLDAVRHLDIPAHLLPLDGRAAALRADAFSAVAVLFHDHDLEIAVLQAALAQDTLMIGAMGSRETQGRRLAALRRLGVPPKRLAELIGPIGLIPSARDASTLALSVLAQVVSCHEEVLGRYTAGKALLRDRPDSADAILMTQPPPLRQSVADFPSL